MEPLTSAGRRSRAWLGYGALVLVLAAGPTVLSGLISALSNTITFPITRHWSVAAGGYELFNTNVLLVYVIAVVGVNIILQAGLLSIGQSAMMAVGAYTVAILGAHLHFAFGVRVVLAGLLAGGVGIVLGLPSLRLGPFTLALMTAGYSLVATSLILALRGLTGGGDGLSGVNGPSSLSGQSGMYWLVAPLAVASVAFAHNFLRSPLGREGRAVHSSALAARALGINVYLVKLRAFAVGSMLGGIAGAVYAPVLGFVSPDTFAVSLAILLLLMALLGGSGTLVGPLIGSVLLFRIPIAVDKVTTKPGEISLLIYGTILLLSVYLAPKGVMSLWWLIRQRFHPRADSSSLAPVPRIPPSQIVNTPESGPDTSLTVRKASKRLGGVAALREVDIQITPGRVHAVIGPNGSGKTTLLNILAGFLQVDTGDVVLHGRAITKLAPHVRARMGLGRTFQTPVVFEDLTCAENVMCGLDRRLAATGWAYLLRLPAARRAERETYAQAVGVLSAVKLSDRANSPASALPPGERRLLEIARILATAPRIVLMDEPVAGLAPGDVAVLEEVIRALREAGIGLVLVEHHMDMVMRVADEITVLDHGQLIAHGDPARIRRDPAVIAAYLGGDVPETQGQAAASAMANRSTES